ncbi:MAG: carboxylating nicotinate-nucleotide diphosphorylase [Demequinaceae bacterium]|nr:carboxylating nicotinate-nucleotide diphosphorylase [Demequinaceae bacterium]
MPETLNQHQPLDLEWLMDVVTRALNEDLGGDPGRDVTTQAIIDPESSVTGELVVREAGVVAGIPVIHEALSQVASRFSLDSPWVSTLKQDGDRVQPGDVLAEIAGSGHVILMAERTILNFMCRASGIATHTRRWADALKGTNTKVLDTRKTIPCFRELEKYAVRCGGGVNKRMGLFDVAMIKDNHVIAAGGVLNAIEAVRDRFPDVAIQVEVERLSQAVEAVEAGARFLLLDNMPDSGMREIIEYVRSEDPRPGAIALEATGGMTLERAAEVAALGVDFISVGGLTHSSDALDLALDLH